MTREIWLKLMSQKPNTMGLREKKRRGLRANIRAKLFQKMSSKENYKITIKEEKERMSSIN